jgi:sugar O-acyltransferase (sialic acid O-acetyltransferase NeuD family)
MKLLLWGAGGHAKVVLDIARAMEIFTDIRFLDDAAEKRPWFRGCPILGGVEWLHSLDTAICSEPMNFLISIGDNRIRARRYAAAAAAGLPAATLLHPSAIVSPSAMIGEGTVIMPRAIVNADARIGRNCILNTGAIVEHDCVIGDHVHISPGAVLGGGVRVGDFTLVGTGAHALPRAVIEEGAVVGAGAVVLHRVPACCTAVGVPARLIGQSRELVWRVPSDAVREAVGHPGGTA